MLILNNILHMIQHIIIILIGLAVGSFLNCFIYRLALPNFSFKDLTGFKNRSYCPSCKHILSWQDLIPVVGFLLLKGKCRHCRQKISWQYPLVEVSTAIIFLLIFNFQFSSATETNLAAEQIFFNCLSLAYYWIISALLIVIFVYDLKHYIIPDKIIYPATAIVFIYQAFKVFDFNFNSLDLKILINPISSAFFASLFFLAMVLMSRGRWMGIGDIKLAFLMGLFLGWPNILIALLFAFYSGALIGLGLIIFGKKKLKSKIPFGPFLAAGTFFALFLGKNLLICCQGLF